MYCDSSCCMQLPGMHSRRKTSVAYKDTYKIGPGLLRDKVACSDVQHAIALSTTRLLMTGYQAAETSPYVFSTLTSCL